MRFIGFLALPLVVGCGGSNESADGPPAGTCDDGGIGCAIEASIDAPPPPDGGPGQPTDDSTPADDRGAVTTIDVATGMDVAPTPDARGADVASEAPPVVTVDAAGDAANACGTCAAYGTPVVTGNVQAANLNALSGIAASWRNPGVLYVHNDRNTPQFFAVSEAGGLLGTFSLSGATGEDFEDIEVAKCPTGTCVYLADIGGNIAPRTTYAVLRVAEPDVNVARPVAGTTMVPSERFAFSYPDGAHNAESLIVDPNTGTVYVITKLNAGMRSSVYRFPPLAAGSTATLVKVADLPVPAAGDQPATAASAHPCGAGFLLRTNNTLYEFRITPGAPFEDAFRATPAMVPVGTEVQGEGVTYRADGRGYYTTSEGNSPPIHRVLCR